MIIEVISWTLISFGGILLFSAGLALIRFEDPYMKIHASSKASFGGAVILSAFLILEGISEVTGLLLLVLIFMLATSPILGHAMGRAAHLEGMNTDEIGKEAYKSKDGKVGGER
ncbi:MAG: cation:proton antiporter [Candidatus Natronoplasma sp.]